MILTEDSFKLVWLFWALSLFRFLPGFPKSSHIYRLALKHKSAVHPPPTHHLMLHWLVHCGHIPCWSRHSHQWHFCRPKITENSLWTWWPLPVTVSIIWNKIYYVILHISDHYPLHSSLMQCPCITYDTNPWMDWLTIECGHNDLYRAGQCWWLQPNVPCMYGHIVVYQYFTCEYR